jgi:hypothetical protein
MVKKNYQMDSEFSIYGERGLFGLGPACVSYDLSVLQLSYLDRCHIGHGNMGTRCVFLPDTPITIRSPSPMVDQRLATIALIIPNDEHAIPLIL